VPVFHITVFIEILLAVKNIWSWQTTVFCHQLTIIVSYALLLITRIETRNPGQIHFIDLFGRKKLFGIVEIDFFAHENIEQVGVDVSAQFELAKYGQGFGERFAFFVGSILGGECLENIRDAHDPGLYRHLVARQSARIALAVHALVMPAGLLRDIFKMPGPGQ
jgi:hypothetical protein